MLRRVTTLEGSVCSAAVDKDPVPKRAFWDCHHLVSELTLQWITFVVTV